MAAVCPHCSAALSSVQARAQFCLRCGQTLPRDLPITPDPPPPAKDPTARPHPFLVSFITGTIYFLVALVVLNEDLSPYLAGRLVGYTVITSVVMGFVVREFRWGWLRALGAYPLVFGALVVWSMRR